MHRALYAVGDVVLGIGVTMLFGQAVPFLASLGVDWPLFGAITAIAGIALLVAGLVAHTRTAKAGWSRSVRFLTDPLTGDEVFRNISDGPIQIFRIDNPGDRIDHIAVGYPTEIATGGQVPLNPRLKSPGSAVLTINWNDVRGRSHTYRIPVGRIGPMPLPAAARNPVMPGDM